MVNLIRRIGIVIVFLLVCVTGGLWMMTGKSAKIQAKEKYILKIYAASPVDVEKIKKILNEEGYSNVSSAKVKRVIPKKSGLRVVSYFDKKELAEGYVKLLNEKKFESVIKEVPNEERVFIQVQGSFSDKKKAEKTAAKAKDIIHITFNVEENFKDINIQAHEIVVNDIAESEKAEALKNKLSEITKDIEMTTKEESAQSPDNGEKNEKSEKPDAKKPAEKAAGEKGKNGGDKGKEAEGK
ncbi:MAG: hypothetical protein LWY06_12745 [Firmicutes bacterium]|nr:hypothetical protein [Bacillota bacterium]